MSTMIPGMTMAPSNLPSSAPTRGAHYGRTRLGPQPGSASGPSLESLDQPSRIGVMNKSAGMGVMAFGIVLVVIGAIMKFAVSARTSGFDINKSGLILLLVGIAVFIVSLLVIALGGRSRSTIQTDVRETPTGHERTEQRDDWTT